MFSPFHRIVERLTQKRFNQYLKEWEQKQDQALKELSEKAGKRIKKAFTAGGVQYFQFEDINDILCGRAFAARDFFSELTMKCDREYLLAHTKKMDEILTSTQINIGTIGQLNLQLKERLELILSPETIYKCASVIYFDETESPYGFDYNYSRTKIQKWKELEVSDFFLTQRLRDLIPALDLSDGDLKTYIKVGQAVEEEHLKTLESISTT